MKHLAIISFMAAASVAAAEQTPLKVDSVVIRLIEQVEVPARERGVIARLHVREGQVVKAGDELAQIDDTESRLELNRARFELARARQQLKNTAKLKIAEKSLELANVELKRALEAVIRYEKAVSRSERDKLQLEVDRAKLDVEDAQQELALARILADRNQNDVDIAENRILQRKITSPIDGVVVQVNHRRGEWVEPGESVIRIVRIDRLRAEGFLGSQHVKSSLAGRSVQLVVDLPGRGETHFSGQLRFVSPEIDPVDGMIRLWAEIENDDLLLRPGLRGSLLIGDANPAALQVGTLSRP